MDRRAFIAGVTALSSTPNVTRAQSPSKVYRVGCLWPVPAPAPRARAALEAGLRDLGWQPGTDILFEHRFADRQSDIPGLAVSLVAARVAVIVAFTPLVIAGAARATTEIPIVMVAGEDPRRSGFAVSLARPGENITGITFTSPEQLAKSLEILKALVPGMTRVQILRNPDAYPPTGPYVTALETTARALRLAILFSDVRTREDIERVVPDLGQPRVSAIFAMPDAFATARHGALIAVLALMHRLPALLGLRDWAQGGELASYGPDQFEDVRRAAFFVDRILRGARARDLPIERPSRLKLVINLRTAGALGLTVPGSLLQRADQVIE
ncbi:MAG: ABC transporter substrate-binding protein [Candidatus Rokubacteria bacterium]|nr:ABC transporter substrate-binding protein [Candidatus Rokubacteria bacterium]